MTRNTPRILAGLACLLLLAGCGQEAADAPAPQAPYEIVTNLSETMEWILEPAADVIWDSAGFIITAAGEEDLSPTTQEGWAQVVHAAAMIAEAGNLMMLPGRSAGADWNEYAAGMTAAGKEAMAAAQAHDADALFDAGGRIYQVCRACHNQYWADARKD